MLKRILFDLVLTVGVASAPAFAEPPTGAPTARPTSQNTELDLEKAFHTRSPWRLTVTEGVPGKDYGDNDAPGALTLCLRKGPSGTCVSNPVTPTLRARAGDEANAWEPHELLTAKVVDPGGPNGAPLLLLVTGSLHSGNGDQLVATELVRYDSAGDKFRRVFSRSTGRNNNQEIRFVADGPLRGGLITAEPQQRSPYGYWILVDQPSSTGAYRQVLRYASATRYDDGNPLAVIDAEMPNILSRLGLWKRGDPLPVPSSSANSKPCVHPTLRHSVMWCE